MTAAAGCYVLALAAVAMAAAALWMAWRAHRAVSVPPSQRMREVMGAIQAGEVQRLPELLRCIDNHLRSIEQRLGRLEHFLPAAIQKIGLVRFDAEPDMGGKVSFALALLDYNDDGILITSVHRLEGTRVFLREVVGGQTTRELLPEESRALNMAVDEMLQARRRRPIGGSGAPAQERKDSAERASAEARPVAAAEGPVGDVEVSEARHAAEQDVQEVGGDAADNQPGGI